jgi:hypothetical protein
MALVGAHKQIVNRLLEPFAHIRVVVTATEWENFYKLRRHPDAQPEIKALADAMWEAHQASTPKKLEAGEWHLPYVTAGEYVGYDDATLLKISTARCARVSYVAPGESTASVEKDLELYDRLVGSEPVHASPTEHQATPDKIEETGAFNQLCWINPQLHGNFVGWCQHRKLMEAGSVT